MRGGGILRQTASEKSSDGRSGNHFLILSIALCAYLLLSFLVFDPKLHTGGDNAGYICLARSMVEGKGYRDIYRPDEPPHTLYPFGYPLLLAAVMSVFRGSYVALKMLSLLSGGGCVVLAYLLLHGRCSRICLLSVLALFCVSPLLLDYGHWILSDVPFTFFALLSLLLLRKSETDRRRFSPLFIASVICMVFTYYIRPVGAALIGGALLCFAFRKQVRKALLVLAIAAALVIPWSLRTSLVSEGVGYSTPFLRKTPYDIESGRIGLGDLLLRLKVNSETYFVSAIPQAVFSMRDRFLPVRTRNWRIFLFGILVSGLIVLGFVEEMRHGLDFLHYSIILYVGILLIWPQVWATDRFILPLLPFVFLYFLRGGQLLTRRLVPRARRRLGLVLVAVLLFSGIGVALRDVPQTLRAIRSYARGDRMAGYSLDWVNYYEAATFAARITHPKAVFMARKPALFYLFSGRKCVIYPYTFDTDKIMESLREDRVSYVVIDAFAWTTTTLKYLLPAILNNNTDFQVLYLTRPPTTYVLRYIGGSSDATEE